MLVFQKNTIEGNIGASPYPQISFPFLWILALGVCLLPTARACMSLQMDCHQASGNSFACVLGRLGVYEGVGGSVLNQWITDTWRNVKTTVFSTPEEENPEVWPALWPKSPAWIRQGYPLQIFAGYVTFAWLPSLPSSSSSFLCHFPPWEHCPINHFYINFCVRIWFAKTQLKTNTSFIRNSPSVS